MKRFLFSFILLLIYSTTTYAQVGIGTTNPTKDLDIDGELRIRNLPSQPVGNSNLLTTDDDGNIGRTSSFLLSNVETDIAAANVDRRVVGVTTVNNVNLGLSVSVTIPANKETIVIINYSVPIGLESFTQPARSYYGIRFLKDGVEAEAGSRKYTCNINGSTSNMITVSNVFTETFASSPVERTIVYSLNGYIEQRDSGTHTYRFNMWDPVGTNYNWGRATIIKQVYTK